MLTTQTTVDIAERQSAFVIVFADQVVVMVFVVVAQMLVRALRITRVEPCEWKVAA
tara:strand:+ start:205 stop:372 length:168 start_codon:yes stop_codon:yes gene_type:complete